jgi:hypothetical protein
LLSSRPAFGNAPRALYARTTRVTNGAAFGLGLGLGFALSVARLGLWVSPLRPRGRTAKMVVFAATFVLTGVAAFAMPTFTAGLLLWLGNGAGLAVSTPIVFPLAYILLRKHETRPPPSE